jgi:hypothetical protein
MGTNNIQILYYANYATLFAKNEDDFQRLLHKFLNTIIRFNILISIEKTESIIISKESIRYKIMVDNKLIKQLMKYNYFDIVTSRYKNLLEEVQRHTRQIEYQDI